VRELAGLLPDPKYGKLFHNDVPLHLLMVVLTLFNRSGTGKATRCRGVLKARSASRRDLCLCDRDGRDSAAS
jgi:hypothetical protein